MNPAVLDQLREHLNHTVVNCGNDRNNRVPDLLSGPYERRKKQQGEFVKTLTNKIFSVMHCTPEKV